MSRKVKKSEDAAIDLTPMIDVVFQLIIFFIVTIVVSEAKDEDVKLEYGPHGVPINPQDGNDSAAHKSVLIIDVGPHGRISVNNWPTSDAELRRTVRDRLRQQGNTFEIWIRGDYRVQHSFVRHVMDVCTSEGVGRVHFVAIQDPRTTPSIRHVEERRARVGR